MDKITVSNLEVHYRVGVPDEERAKPQRLLITVELAHGFEAAARNDDLRATIDYYAVSRRLIDFGKERSWRLIETLACEIAEVLLREFRPESVRVEVKKFIIPEAQHVSVEVSRTLH